MGPARASLADMEKPVSMETLVAQLAPEPAPAQNAPAGFPWLKLLLAMAIVAGEQLVSGDVVIQFADGEVERDGDRLTWRTVGVYRMEGDRVAEAWLVPVELAAFDEVWTALGRRTP